MLKGVPLEMFDSVTERIKHFISNQYFCKRDSSIEKLSEISSDKSAACFPAPLFSTTNVKQLPRVTAPDVAEV